MRIFHIALASDWDEARTSGTYTVSTLGHTLREVGFIHAAHADQWQQVRAEFYAEVDEPLVLLTIDTDRLSAPVVVEDGFPHIYGALEVDAVVRVVDLAPARPIDPGQATRESESGGSTGAASQKTFMQLFVEEMAFRAMLGFAAMVFAGVLGFTAQQRYGDGVALAVALIALVVAFVVAVVLARRRDARVHQERAGA